MTNSMSAKSQFANRWGWYSAVYALAGGNVLNFDQVTDMQLKSALTFLTFEKQKINIEQKMIKK